MKDNHVDEIQNKFHVIYVEAQRHWEFTPKETDLISYTVSHRDASTIEAACEAVYLSLNRQLLENNKSVIKKFCLSTGLSVWDSADISDFGILKEDVISVTVEEGKIWLFYWSTNP